MKKLMGSILSLVLALTLTVPAFAVDVAVSNDEISAITDTSPREDNELLTFEPIAIAVPSVPDSLDGTALRITDQFIVRSGIKSTSGGQFTWSFNVDCPTSPIDKPNIKVTVQLKGSFTTMGGSASNIGSSVFHEYKTTEEYGTDYTWKTPAKTGYYHISFTIYNYDTGTTSYGTGTTFLTNKTGHAWTFNYSDLGKSLPMPRADWAKGAVHQRPSNLAAQYYKEYTEKTGNTLLTALYEVHHIQPLAYGGDNTYGNLIHLPKSLHSSVTGWFNGY